MILSIKAFFDKLKKSTFIIKFTHWEFWSFNVVYLPVIIYYLWLSFRARSFTFFTASNPGLQNAGFIGESKSLILKKINHKYIPKYIVVDPGNDFNEKLLELKRLDINFPVIVKPDVGERGIGIEKVNDVIALETFLNKIRVPYLIQEYIDYPLELGIFYYRFPGQAEGKISSIVIKGFLSVMGNGISTLGSLISDYPRARFRKDYLQKKFHQEWNDIVHAGKKLILENIGNHSRGTTFYSGQAYINPTLLAVMESICIGMDGFFFGRFDLKCTSWNDLYEGRNIKILELNGAGSEPAHIYEPGFSFWEGQKVLFQHWKVLFDISILNHKQGVPYLTIKKALEVIQSHAHVLREIKMQG